MKLIGQCGGPRTKNWKHNNCVFKFCAVQIRRLCSISMHVFLAETMSRLTARLLVQRQMTEYDHKNDWAPPLYYRSRIRKAGFNTLTSLSQLHVLLHLLISVFCTKTLKVELLTASVTGHLLTSFDTTDDKRMERRITTFCWTVGV